MTRGERFAAAVRDQYQLTLDCDLVLDEIAGVVDLLDAGGLTVAEQRAQRTLLSRLLYQLALPDPEDTKGRRDALTSRKATKAARARWAREAI